MAEVTRVGPEEARERLQSPQHDALLVCGYDDPEKFRKNQLEGAISLDELRRKADSLEKDRELIFYCA